MCTHAFIKIVITISKSTNTNIPIKKPNSLINVIEEPKVQIIIVEELDAIINIPRIILLAATKRKLPKSFRKNKI
jgi:hypothetical protein